FIFDIAMNDSLAMQHLKTREGRYRHLQLFCHCKHMSHRIEVSFCNSCEGDYARGYLAIYRLSYLKAIKELPNSWLALQHVLNGEIYSTHLKITGLAHLLRDFPHCRPHAKRLKIVIE